jgi:hypothetical protein
MVSMSVPKGEIYYTTDLTDPRGANGQPSPSARRYEAPVAIDRNTLVRARALLAGSIWTELVEGSYVVEIPTIALTEIMYNPVGGIEYQFIELHNFGAEEVDLYGGNVTRGVLFDFSDPAQSKLSPGGYAVLVRNPTIFASRYDVSRIRVLGSFRGSLHARSEPVGLIGPVNEQVFEVTYRSLWYPETDGQGRSLVLIDARSPRETWSDRAESWRPSLAENGSPGAADGEEPPRGGGQIAGDFTQDGRLSFADALRLLHYLFKDAGSGQLPCGDGSLGHLGNVRLLDGNGDAKVEIADAIHSLRYLFVAGPAPVLGSRCARIADCPEVCAP